ncbi:efflux RND transporter periplasmic adaptor subunit [Acidithiobacillus thiooxidans]|uniref:Efflux RND transporter periplasmic adaptor subunit n=2 Tax=Acidithiobacillales TaxID=225057 RepID=A0AAE3CJU9_9PROT|nr:MULTISPECIES: efflux RND transporter periplasmic adaptor subunit [Acidithiobacillaceae]MBU2788193.1 efflux RND transporter periplasmic adaptor subunit [Igneacidithiobacillus copahuensis]MBU2797506.1 efflux RND transporter periplasmic adaptor subunit [Acidithiobacillus sp. VAN18-2]MBU2839237.1 efflux RND transporter periplasmic adaptor subunit [Acidithiobacillus thiooxidans]
MQCLRFFMVLPLYFWLSPAWAVPVTVAIIQNATWTQTVSVMGQVKSVGMVTLTAPMTGRVVGPFQPPGMVSSGAVIAHIDPPGLQAQLQAARAQVDYAQIALQRNQRLLKDGVVARSTVDSSEVAYKQALGNARALRAEQTDQTLTAPFTGSINYLVVPGAVVTTGTPIATLSGRARPWVEALVPPQDAFRVAKGSFVRLQGNGWQGSGRVRSIGNSARQSGLVSVVIRLPTHSALLPGEWISVHLQVPREHTLAVPVTAVVMHGAHALVFIDELGHARPVPVKVVGTEHGIARIIGHLKAGEQVVMSGNTRLSNQTPLEIRK